MQTSTHIPMASGSTFFRTTSVPLTIPIVFVVADDLSQHDTLELLAETAGCRVETFASPEEFLASPRATSQSCLILDVGVTGVNHLEFLSRVTADRRDTPVIVISSRPDVRMSVQAMKAGAMEFLTMPYDEDLMLESIQQALERSRRAMEHGVKLQKLRDSFTSLTRREREVMTLVASGLLNKQVGGELGISEITVKAHRGQVMRKMNASSLPALVHMAAMLGVASALSV